MRAHILKRYPALAARGYRRYWLGSFASVGATQLITLGQGWLVFELTGSALALGWLGVAAALPSLLVTLYGGVVADRYNKRQILRITSLSTALALALLALLDYAGAVTLWQVLTIAAIVSTITGIDWPTRSAIFPLLVERPAYMSAVALNAVIWQSTRMTMPALGGLLIAYTDTWVIFALGAAGFLVMYQVLAGIEVREESRSAAPALAQIIEAFSFIRRTPLFASLVTLTFAGMLLSNAYIQILPVFADLMGRSETGYGMLLSAGGIGSVIGTLLMSGAERRERLGVLLLACASAAAGVLCLFALASGALWFYPALLLALVASLFASSFMVLTMSILQLLVPDTLRGRVMGIYSMGFSLVPLGGIILGTLTELWSAPAAVMTANLTFAALLLAIGWRQRAIRGLAGSALDTPLPHQSTVRS
ncbi:MAG: MFS transporter [Pseudomonadota bacterium]